ncbi:MAG: starch synthase [Herbinix sp.]|jgi:starch synthase|nr:starch synthase [Herbinix sp.]
MKILFATSEAYPFIMTGGLGDVAGALPRAIQQNSHCCRVVLPLYYDTPENLRKDLKFITKFSVTLSWREQYCGVFEAHVNDTVYYLLDNEYYFKRPGAYGHYDDGERFAFFSKAVLEMIKVIDFKPEVIHANDWQTAMIPVYKKLIYSEQEDYKNCKTVFTIHNILNQGQYDINILTDVLGLKESDLSVLEYNGVINTMKAAIETADAITTVSPSYAEELINPAASYGLSDILRNNSDKVYGIINGIHTDIYNPETDDIILQNYSIEDLSGKSSNKKALQKMVGLPEDTDIPIISMITRFVDHKGLDLVNKVIEEILTSHVQLIMLGKGDRLHETFFMDVAERYPGKMALKIGFIPDIAHKIYAGSDLFLMPSKFEPCGLSQMIAMRYGTIPIVRETGGLKDTVIDYSSENGNGFTFQAYDAAEMLEAIRRAQDLFKNKKAWETLIERAMLTNHSWQSSANQYIELYKNLNL